MVSKRFAGSNEEAKERPIPAYPEASAEGQRRCAVGYLRVAAEGHGGFAALVDQQNVLQRFADHNGYAVGHWYVKRYAGEMERNALSRLLSDVVSHGHDYNAVLVRNYSRFTRSVSRLSELHAVLTEHGVDLVSVADAPRLADLERQLAELTNDCNGESAG